MNDIHVYSIQTYEKLISHHYYHQIVTHEICDGPLIDFSNPSYYDIIIFKNGIKWSCKPMHHQI
jgi:hypothetical protein